MEFTCTKDKSELYGSIITLRYGKANEAGYRSVSIAPDLGNSMFRFVADGYEILQYDMTQQGVFGGNPLLYPTPNRVRDCQFRFMGEVYKQVKGGKPKFIHGLVNSERWSFSDPVASADGASFSTWVDFKPGFDGFEGFPFPHRLTVDYKLGQTGITITYTVDNQSDKPLPYGFGMHPFFTKLSGEQGTTLCVPAQRVFEREPDCLPTGKILDVAGTKYDLRKPVAVGKLDLDDVFTDMTDQTVKIHYEGLGMTLKLVSTAEFGKMVVFTPAGKTFFCAENQTCSTDAHNLYDRGLRKESGLIILQPGEKKTGSVTFEVAKD